MQSKFNKGEQLIYTKRHFINGSVDFDSEVEVVVSYVTNTDANHCLVIIGRTINGEIARVVKQKNLRRMQTLKEKIL